MRNFLSVWLGLVVLTAFSHARTIIYDVPASTQMGSGNFYSTTAYYHRIGQSTGQDWSLDQFTLHVHLGFTSPHSLTGKTYGMEVYSTTGASAMEVGSLLQTVSPASVSNQYPGPWGDVYRSFTFDFNPSSVIIANNRAVLLRFTTNDPEARLMVGSGTPSAGWQVGARVMSGGVLASAGNTLGTVTVSAVPEPSALSLLVVGLGGVIALRRARRKAD